MKSRPAVSLLGLSLLFVTLSTAGRSAERADELLPVDCLLPGAVRKLGSRMTYVTQRRPIKTVAVDCEIRGGEYVAYDRADYGTAMRIWLPMAEQGDPKSQNYVGEIYEKGLGVEPNFELAAQWYLRAAEQGFQAAQINLGQLYEMGLGVEKNRQVALQWYEKASGINRKLDKVVSFQIAEDNDRQLQAANQSLTEKDREIQAQQEKIRELIQKLDASQSSQKALVEQTERAEQAAQQLQQEKQELEQREQRLAVQRIELQEQRQALQKSGERQALGSKELAEELTKLEKQSQALQQQKKLLQEQQLELQKKQQAQQQLDQKLADQQQQITAANAELESLKMAIESSRNSLAALSEATAQVASAAPVIQLIEPKVLRTRGNNRVPARSDLTERTVIGQIQSGVGLMELLVNEKSTSIDENGFFQERISVTEAITPVTIVAIDKKGQRSDLSFDFEKKEAGLKDVEQTDKTDAPEKSNKIPKLEYGAYHALVIGNQDYEFLPDLKTAVSDLTEVSNTLESRYGFTVKRLRNATRYDILSALNELRGNLTEEDNLLIYYAGHGTLDEVNNRGHWMPVDAEMGNTANWISNIAITDILNAMNAKKVLVVSDSCYSGAMTRSALARLDAGRSEQSWVSWLKMLAQQRSRLALSSGGLAPVLDGGGGQHSVFAKAFLDVLNENETVIEGKQLHGKVAELVSFAASAAQFEQVPQYAPIKFGGHESGDFLFVPQQI